jgi:methylaspartate mutase sigma subunit
LTIPEDGPKAASAGTVVTGVIGDDIHVIGIRVMEHALRRSGFKVVPLGVLTSQKEFIEAAIESAADAILISSLNGHGEVSLHGLRDGCIESGIGDILIYAGGQLTIRRPDWADVETLFLKELRLDRIYPPDVDPEDPIRDLVSDIRKRRSVVVRESAPEEPASGREEVQRHGK